MAAVAEWEHDRRRAWASMFDLMEQYQADHPEASDDEAFEAVCFRVIPERNAAIYDYEKDRRRGI